MNTSSPSNRAYGLAAICALIWFAFWLSAFHPISAPATPPKPPPAITLCRTPNPTLKPLLTPTLFALPSTKGFSGTFPENTIHTPRSIENQHPSKTYLSRQPPASPVTDQINLIESIVLPESELPAPGAKQTTLTRQPEKIAFFFSPELQPRATQIEPATQLDPLPNSSLRIQLTVRSDGTVEHAFFETPTEHPALLQTIRRLRFTPAANKTVGWLDIRFTPQGNPKHETPKHK